MHQNEIQNLKDALKKQCDGVNADLLCGKYASILSNDYVANYTVDEIACDLQLIDKLSPENLYAISLNPSKKGLPNLWQIKLFRYNEQVSLSRGLPIIENFGVKLLDEHPYQIKLDDDVAIFVCDFGVEVPVEFADKISDLTFAAQLQESIVAAFNRQIENDALNKLVLFSGLNSHQIALLRAVTQYLGQTTLPYSRQYMAECLRSYPIIARHIFSYFAAKFNLANHSQIEANKIHTQIVEDLREVASLDHDHILSAYFAVVEAMLRTNYYQLNSDGSKKSYISFKLASAKLSFLPKPLPLYEIFVYSLRFEAIHLRGGKVARGGLRWSDRREDFRTEVLGLMKAQVVKNSIIVPTGSKGGFVCKKLPAISNRKAYMAEGIACYKNFISGLLDLTDNLIAGNIVPPKDVICYDAADPYLVVAADKGTATFSDYANQLSEQYGFWLGDAFASGGSAGYDHKKIGITAKGAWESAKRHFRHLGIDIQTQDFTVIGVGDMSGDVFGNGMLLSKHIRLIAAFNHQHIFLDPNPNPATSYVERERLFNLPNASWEDYDVSKISKGGGVFDRKTKIIALSPEVKQWLGVTVDELSANELIHEILKAPADMLYNGGIGTYVKAESESHETVKDKANDSLRVNGNELQVRVIIEGGNLGVTQLGRIEFANRGRAIYTDAIDNSAGVDCSDHEVNLKILFADIMQSTGMKVDERNKVLELMTNDIANLVLRDNYLQTEVLRYSKTRSVELFAVTANFIDKLEKKGELDRKVEFLPTQHEVLERQRIGSALSLPELAVLLAYSKITLNQDILNSELVNLELFDELLFSYFPEFVQKNYADYIKRHYLRKEIIANQLANFIINRMGITFVSRFEDEFHTDVNQIVPAFFAAYKLINAEEIFTHIETLDNKVSADVQIQMFIRVKKSIERMSRWILREVKPAKIATLIADYQKDADKLLAVFPKILAKNSYGRVAKAEDEFIAAGVPDGLAATVARSNYIPQILDVVILARETNYDLDLLADNYFYIGRSLRIDWLRKSLIDLPEGNKWQALSRSALLADGYKLYGTFVRFALRDAKKDDSKFATEWVKRESEKVAQISIMFDELQSYKVMDLAMLSAAVREVVAILAS